MKCFNFAGGIQLSGAIGIRYGYGTLLLITESLPFEYCKLPHLYEIRFHLKNYHQSAIRGEREFDFVQ